MGGEGIKPGIRSMEQGGYLLDGIAVFYINMSRPKASASRRHNRSFSTTLLSGISNNSISFQRLKSN